MSASQSQPDVAMRNADAAMQAGALTQAEADHLILCIRAGMPLDVRQHTGHRNANAGRGQWQVYDGSMWRDTSWWKAHYAAIIKRDSRGKR